MSAPDLPVRPYQMLPPLDADQRHILRQSIRECGVLEPVVFDEDGEILDGHHRVEIAEELGIEYPSRVITDLDRPGKWMYAVTVNVARRHLDQSTRSGLVAQMRLRGMSIRDIAKATGLPKTTVARDLAQVSQMGHLPETITGADNKTYASTRPTPTPGPVDTTTSPADSGATPECLGVDMDCGRPLPCPDHPTLDLGMAPAPALLSPSAPAREPAPTPGPVAAPSTAPSGPGAGEEAAPTREGGAASKPSDAERAAAAVQAALDKFVPDPGAPARAWQKELHVRLKPVHTFLLWLKTDDVTAFAGEHDVTTLRHLATSFADAHRRAVDAGNANVTQLRRIK